MVNKLVFVWDFLYHNPMCDGTYHYYAVDLFRPLVKIATGLDIVELRTLKNADGEEFSRQKFYDLSDYGKIEKSYFSYDITKIKQPSIDYLKTFIDSQTFVFGFEMGAELKNILTDLNINFVNFWYHSWKLFDDAFLMINTNNEAIFKKLCQYKTQKEKFDFYATYWKHFTKQKGELDYLDFLEDNSCLFVGQTLRDKSTDKDGTMLNVLYFKEELEELSNQYSKIYYIPHPLAQYNEEIEKYLKETPYIEKLENVSTYHLLMSDKIQKVVGISSSVLYEAKFFGKDVTYFYKPLFKIDEEFSLETFISVFHDYYNPHFWADILSAVMKTNTDAENSIWFSDIANKFRNINHIYYGYQNFNENYRLKAELENNLTEKADSFSRMVQSAKQKNDEELLKLKEIVKLINRKKEFYYKYQKYRILSKVTIGRTKKRYIDKKKKFKDFLVKIKNFEYENT